MNDKAGQGHPAECTASLGGLGCLMLREAARAVVWGAMLLVVVFISLGWAKQQVKEGVEFTAHAVVQEAKKAVLAPDTFVPIKKNAKEAIEFAAKKAADEYVRAQRQLVSGR